MKVVCTLVGVVMQGRSTRLKWPKGWPVPREGETVELPNLGPLSVRTVVWYPEGDEEDSDPYVYLVIGVPR